MAKPADEFHANKVYAEQLFPLGHGMPLWEPEPNGTGEVEIGDVGYIQDGGFYRLFNATHTRDDPINLRFGCPDAFCPLVTNDRLYYMRPHALSPGTLCSKSIKRAELDVQAASPAGGGGLSFTYTGGRGAILNLLDPATRMRLHEDRAVVEYMAQNFDTWYHFATETLRMDLHQSDIVFVRGWMKTSRWAVAAFAQGGQSGTLTFNINPAFPASASLNVSVAKDVTVSHQYRAGPFSQTSPAQYQSITQNPDNSSMSLAESEYKCDQCIFLHYYKMRSRFWRPRVIKAAGGPRDFEYYPDDEVDLSVASEPLTPDVDDIESIPGTYPMPDPVDDILEYILESSTANVAIAHDGLVSQLCSTIELDLPEKLSTLLGQIRPSIEVDEQGVGTLSIMRRRARSDKKHSEAIPESLTAKTDLCTPVFASSPSNTPSPTSGPLSSRSQVIRDPLPRRSSKRSTSDTEQSASPSQKRRKSVADENATPISVLIVDDNPINLTILSTFMRKKNIKYDVAKNGEEAVQKWRIGEFRLILMDLQMPVMDGLEATKEIRRMERDKDASSDSVPLPPGRQNAPPEKSALDIDSGLSTASRPSAIIVALTASSLPSDRTAALSAGCDDFLTKPVSMHWLNSKIVEWR
ncbi:response regulator receiver [Gelatoporia subvermispora B]|uniref:Response regulator receiver n=1 Tax=Ceriporiopsis subvermispora (strain B) TaxID=914234 RepID=M2QZS7_CERS8|nr:response regulator receiver [Gelatoporia subvermispora B]